MDLLNDKYQSKSLEYAYNLESNDFIQFGGKALLKSFKNSVSILLKNVFPNHNWQSWRFSDGVESGFWLNENNIKDLMDYIGKKLEYKSMDDWYNLTKGHIIENGGGTLLEKYNGSPSKLLMSVYPEYNWILFKFDTVPKNYWDDINNQKEYLDWLGNQLNYKSMDDWYKIRGKDIEENGGKGLLSKFNCSPTSLLKSAYPNHIWQPKIFKQTELKQLYIGK